MITALMVECKHCRTLDSFTTRSNTPSVDTLANRAGWRKTVKGWLCPSCRREEPSPIGVCPICREDLFGPSISGHIYLECREWKLTNAPTRSSLATGRAGAPQSTGG